MAAKKPISKPKRKRGRPKVVIDWKAVDMYLKAGCSGTGIADMLGVDRKSLYNACERDNKIPFSTYSQQKKETGDDMLRAKQFDKAMKGDVGMLIWLGKQRLGQKDKFENDNNNTNTTVEPITGMVVK